MVVYSLYMLSPHQRRSFYEVLALSVYRIEMIIFICLSEAKSHFKVVVVR